MPTTTNFGWTTPADTDLVKDGALAIRTLGNGVDTSFLDHKGGATGDLLVTIDVQVPRILEGKAEAAIKEFAQATKNHDVRNEFMAKAKQ